MRNEDRVIKKRAELSKSCGALRISLKSTGVNGENILINSPSSDDFVLLAQRPVMEMDHMLDAKLDAKLDTHLKNISERCDSYCCWIVGLLFGSWNLHFAWKILNTMLLPVVYMYVTLHRIVNMLGQVLCYCFIPVINMRICCYYVIEF